MSTWHPPLLARLCVSCLMNCLCTLQKQTSECRWEKATSDTCSMQHGFGGEFCVFFLFSCPNVHETAETPTKKKIVTKIAQNVVTHFSKIRPLKGNISPTFSAPLTSLTDTRTQRHQHKPHTTAENLCLKLQSIWWELIDLLSRRCSHCNFMWTF